MLFYSIIFEIVVIVVFTYGEGLNTFLGLKFVEPLWASTGIWVIPAIILYDELRKFIIRKYPDGWVKKITLL
jgi:sodium/potassium-transporting ATPase subunit alpha